MTTSFVSAVKIKSMSQSGDAQANKHVGRQFRWRGQSKREHQQPPGQKPCADVGKTQAIFCSGASKAQDEPLAHREKQYGIYPDDWNAVEVQSDAPVFNNA